MSRLFFQSGGRCMRFVFTGQDSHPWRPAMKIGIFLNFITYPSACAGIHIKLTCTPRSWHAEPTKHAKSTSIPSSCEMVIMMYPIASFFEIYSFLMHALWNGSSLKKINTDSVEMSKSKMAICSHFLPSFNRKSKENPRLQLREWNSD